MSLFFLSSCSASHFFCRSSLAWALHAFSLVQYSFSTFLCSSHRLPMVSLHRFTISHWLFFCLIRSGTSSLVSPILALISSMILRCSCSCALSSVIFAPTDLSWASRVSLAAGSTFPPLLSSSSFTMALDFLSSEIWAMIFFSSFSVMEVWAMLFSSLSIAASMSSVFTYWHLARIAFCCSRIASFWAFRALSWFRTPFCSSKSPLSSVLIAISLFLGSAVALPWPFLPSLIVSIFAL
mmetsp:Transcript_2569/g.8779  ORF Transcript_2569/g.8779 Transcript_2569/m.8779 type:complete len:238 (-) Transcript_2569:165-878(-)